MLYQTTKHHKKTLCFLNILYFLRKQLEMRENENKFSFLFIAFNKSLFQKLFRKRLLNNFWTLKRVNVSFYCPFVSRKHTKTLSLLNTLLLAILPSFIRKIFLPSIWFHFSDNNSSFSLKKKIFFIHCLSNFQVAPQTLVLTFFIFSLLQAKRQHHVLNTKLKFQVLIYYYSL